MGRANVSVIQDADGVVIEVFIDADKAVARAAWLNENVDGDFTVASAVLSDPDNLG